MTRSSAHSVHLALSLERIKAILVEGLTAAQTAGVETLVASVRPLDELEQSLREIASTLLSPAPLAQAGDLFGLSPFEQDVLLLCVGMELDASFAPLFAALQGDPQRAYPTLSLALGTLPAPDWRVLSPAAPLRHWQLLDIGPGRSLTASPLRIDERILTWLTGFKHLDRALQGQMRRVASSPLPLVPSHKALVQRLTQTWVQAQAQGHALPVLQLCGGDGGDRQALAAAACQDLGLGLYQMAIAALPNDHSERHQLARRWHREAMLSNSALLLEGDAGGESQTAQVAQFLTEVPTPVLLSTPARQLLSSQLSQGMVTVDVALPTAQEQAQLWEGHFAAPLPNLPQLVGQFNLNASTIQSVYLSLLGQDVGEEQGEGLEDMAIAPTLESRLWQACRLQARQRMESHAQRIDSAATWDDLILPEAQKATLQDIAAHLRQRVKVHQEWGFGASQRGLGITALFSGSSGTGKTLAAEVLAQSLQLDLYKIDLGAVVSKYIGETEKNLGQVFDAAEAGGAVLLFDEADALFGKRSEVKDSRDRYANMEVSYLLQRMESYRGLAVLTTNLPDAIDRAFLRRIRFIVQFPFPDAAQREAIWRRMFPPQTPTEGLSFRKLARLNVAGGNIRNIALGAAFLAADGDEPVRMGHLLEAARREYRKLELPLTDAEVKGWV